MFWDPLAKKENDRSLLNKFVCKVLMFKIVLQMPESPIIRETEQSLETMSVDDLLWYFSGMINFCNTSQEQSFLLIPETSLLSFLDDFSKIIQNFQLPNGTPEGMVEDLDGNFSILFSMVNERIHIKDAFLESEFTVNKADFIFEAKSFIVRSMQEIENLFSDLIENPSYQQLATDIEERIRWSRKLFIILLIKIRLTHVGKTNRFKGCFKPYNTDS